MFNNSSGSITKIFFISAMGIMAGRIIFIVSSGFVMLTKKKEHQEDGNT